MIFLIKSGDYITRKSYKNDMVFVVLSVKGNMVYLKGLNDRLYADSPVEDCEIVSKDVLEDSFVPENLESDLLDRSEYFFIPAKILHLDGDSEYLSRCMNYYKENK